MKAETKLVVKHEAGLHARPGALFVRTAGKFQSEIRVRNVTRGSGMALAKSMIGVLTLGVLNGHEIHLEADGPDADAALAELRALIESNFGEA